MLPEVGDPARRAACRTDLGRFCKTYGPATFALPWSKDHKKAIQRIEQSVLEGGLFAFAMPRGDGKTALCEWASLWALLYAHRAFVFFIGSEDDKATESVASLQMTLYRNGILFEDFPEVCVPIRCLGGIAQRQRGQTYQGDPTHIGWGQHEIVLPTIPGSGASAGVVRAAGILASIRGARFTRPDGSVIRPDLVVVDDPQTDASARSPSQCRDREHVVAGAVLGLAGAGKKIAGFMPCTVIQAGDMADNILDRNKHPEWRGERFKRLRKFPTNIKLWRQYDQVRRHCLERDGNMQPATDFYVANREEMDKGADPSWPERFNPDEVSGVQHAMNLWLTNEVAFAAEQQQEPQATPFAEGAIEIQPDHVLRRTNNFSIGTPPITCHKVTAFVDVQKRCLYWAVVAWETVFSGYVLSYGAWPDQASDYFTYRGLRVTLADQIEGGVEHQVYQGVKDLVASLFSRRWIRDGDGLEMQLNRLLCDAKWETDSVYKALRESAHSANCFPSFGHGIKASDRPMDEWRRRPGEFVGPGWRVSCASGRPLRHVTYDTNRWKSFAYARLYTPAGDAGAVTLFKPSGRPRQHRMISEHFASEYAIRTFGRGRAVEEWRPRPSGGDNHLWDCLVGCTVAASLEGCQLPTLAGKNTPPKKRERVRYLD